MASSSAQAAAQPGVDVATGIIPRSLTTAVPGEGTVSITVGDTARAADSRPARLVNLSTRGEVSPGNPLILGFAIAGTEPRSVLVRGAGPALGAFGVEGALTATSLQVYASGGTLVAGTEGWSREAGSAATRTGAFPRHNRLVRAGFDCVMECGKPVIAAVNGAAIGAGCVLALVCDIIVVAEDSFMSMTEVEVGLAGGVRHVLRHFGQSNARLMLYTARRFSGPDLYRMNVASACVSQDQLLATAQGIAAEIASKVPLAVEAAKRGFTLTEYLPLSEGYRYEQTQTAALSRTEDTREAQRAFAEKRKPVFKGR